MSRLIRPRSNVIDKVIGRLADAVSDMAPGSVIGIGGFGVVHGFPLHLIAAVRDHGVRDLVVVCNSLGREPTHPVALVSSGQTRKLIAAFSARPGGVAGAAQSISPVPLEVELVPQGLLVERLRAAGAGLGPFYSPVGEDTILADGKERREFGGQRYVLEEPLRLDYALIYARTADRAGNLAFRGVNRNFAPSFAKAARVVVAEVDEIVEAGELAPDQVDLPGIFVDRVVRTPVSRIPQWREPRPDDERRDYRGRHGLAPRDIGARIADLLPDGSYVNLGVGLPTLVSDYIGDRDIMLHAENGLLGYGARLSPDDADNDIYNAASDPVRLRKGASTFDTVTAFEMARGGRLDAVVLGAYQVGADGSFANWTTPGMGGGAIGGAMDLVVRPGQLIIAMRHCERSGRPKVVGECEYPVTAAGRVDLVVSDIAVIERDQRGLVLRECAPGFAPDDVLALTDAPLSVELWADLAGAAGNGVGASGFLAWRESVLLRTKTQGSGE
jgi:3-oxoacid CoA-transferase